jgi:hypothetical protein
VRVPRAPRGTVPRRPLTPTAPGARLLKAVVQANSVFAGLSCLILVACGGPSSHEASRDASSERGSTFDASRDVSSANRDDGAAPYRPCNDGTGAQDCCPSGTAAGEVCAEDAAMCYSRCVFPDDAATQGTRSTFSCLQGTWLAGHGLFPCSRK